MVAYYSKSLLAKLKRLSRFLSILSGSIIAEIEFMIAIAGTIRMISGTEIGIAGVFIIKMYKKLYRVVHSQYLLTGSIITVESKCLIWREKHWFINVTITSAAKIDSGITIIVPIWNWVMFSINVAIVFIIPVHVASIEATWTAPAISCNAVFPSWPCKSTPTMRSFCTVVGLQISAKPKSDV